jgi:predicted DNA-binding transcriptional regulator AlpA
MDDTHNDTDRTNTLQTTRKVAPTLLVQVLLDFQEQRRLAVSEMARLFAIGQPTMWRILTGKQTPSGQTLGAMARAGLRIKQQVLRSL